MKPAIKPNTIAIPREQNVPAIWSPPCLRKLGYMFRSFPVEY